MSQCANHSLDWVRVPKSAVMVRGHTHSACPPCSNGEHNNFCVQPDDRINTTLLQYPTKVKLTKSQVTLAGTTNQLGMDLSPSSYDPQDEDPTTQNSTMEDSEYVLDEKYYSRMKKLNSRRNTPVNNVNINKRKNIRKNNKKIKNKNKNKQQRNTLRVEPHSGTEYEGLFRQHFTQVFDNLDVHSLLHVFETFAASKYLISAKSNVLKCLLAGLLYAKTQLQMTLCGTLYEKIINNVFDLDFLKDWNFEDLTEFLKTGLVDWEAFKNHSGFHAISTLFTYIITFGFFEADQIDCSWGHFELLHIEALKSQVNARDFIDALWKTMAFLSQSATHIMNGDWQSVFKFDDATAEFESEYFYHKGQFSYAISGNYGKMHDNSIHSWEKRLTDAIVLGHKVRRLVKGPAATRINIYVKDLEEMFAQFSQVRIRGDLRIAPYSYLIYGSSCVGKSTLGNFLMRYILEVNGFEHSSEYLATVNSSDKHYSTFRSYILGVFFDDVGNLRAEFAEKSPCNTILEFINNIPLYLIMAEIELKGKVTAQPMVVGITTNVWNLCADTYSNEPASIIRRVADHLHVRVKPQFQRITKSKGKTRVELDTDKVRAVYPEMYDNERDTPFIADVWEIDVYKVEIYSQNQARKEYSSQSAPSTGDPWQLVPVRFNGKILKNISLKELQQYVREASAAHYENQKALVHNDKLMNLSNVCTDCKYANQFCECPKIKIEKQAGIGTWTEYVNASTQNEFRSDLQECITSLVFEGRMRANKLRSTLETHTSHATILFLERLREVAKIYAVKHGWDHFPNWIPNWVEDTPLGAYLNIKYRGNYISWIQRSIFAGQLLQFGLGLGIPLAMRLPIQGTAFCTVCSYTLINPYVFANVLQHCSSIPTFDVRAPCTSLIKHVWNTSAIPTWRDSVWPCLQLAFPTWMEAVVERKKGIEICIKDTVSWLKTPMVAGYCTVLGCASFPRTTLGIYSVVALRNTYKTYGDSRAKSVQYMQNIVSNIKTTSPNVLRDSVIPSFMTSFALYEGIPSIVQKLRKAYTTSQMQEQSALDPTPEEIRAKDMEDEGKVKFYEDKFAQRIKDIIPVEKKMQQNEVVNKLMKNLCYMKRDDLHYCNAIFLKSGFVLMPHHMITKSPSTFEFTRKANPSGRCGNATFKAKVGADDVIQIGTHDLVVAYIPTSGDFTDITHMFGTQVPEVPRTGLILHRNKQGILTINGVTNIRKCTTTNNHVISGSRVKFPGLEYTYPGNFKGLCISPIVTNDKHSYIAGVHLGGDGISHARAGSPTPIELRSAIMSLTTRSHVSNISSEGTFVTKQFGIEVFEDAIHRRSPLVLLPEIPRNYRCYGSTVGRSSVKSKVCDLPIAKTARRLLNIKESWTLPKFRGPDKMKPWLPWLVSLSDSTNPSIGFNGKDVGRAMEDYMAPLVQLGRESGIVLPPLTEIQNVNGIPECRFIDALQSSTSVGFPLGGAKSKFLTETEDPTGIYQHHQILDRRFWTEAYRMEEEYKRGKRCYPVFKAALKDEPTLVTKDKVRVFQAAPLAFQLLVRKYYLPVARMLSLHPLLSECAVGINPASKEWDELGNHVSKYGTSRVLAIDYKKYDLRMPAQLTLCALKVMRCIAEASGYSPEELLVMEGIATDICWPMSAYNGDLLMLIGSNPSGQNLTVYLNGIVNSLLHRLAFFNQYPNSGLVFRDCASLITYGDDAAGSVKWWYNTYNMTTMHAFFKRHDITITMADKDADIVPFIEFEKCDFLKRSFVYDSEFNGFRGPLQENSIFKSLCSIVESRHVSKIEVSAANLEGAADSYFLHGRDIFDSRIKVLRAIAQEHDIEYLTPKLQLSFDERMVRWRKAN